MILKFRQLSRVIANDHRSVPQELFDGLGVH